MEEASFSSSPKKKQITKDHFDDSQSKMGLDTKIGFSNVSSSHELVFTCKLEISNKIAHNPYRHYE